MSEQPPEGNGFSLDDFKQAVSDATLDGMKRYDREREEWDNAVAEQERTRQESENDKAPRGLDFGNFLLTGKRKTG